VATASSTRQVRRRKPVRRYKPIKVSRRRWLVRGVAAAVLVIALLLASAAIARRLAPKSNTDRDHFDAILVLGSPADADGNPSPIQLGRVSEAVREYERGIAPRLILSGGAAHNQYAEADVMANVAASQGIPPSAIFVETKSNDTIQNACYSARIMQTHGWHSAEIVSSDYHLPRVGLIFSHTAIQWRVHAAPPLQAAESASSIDSALETLKTMRYLVYANWAERCEP
jgi:uncharacterized SAM-binding protein YcdF (DUF218 family)